MDFENVLDIICDESYGRRGVLHPDSSTFNAEYPMDVTSCLSFSFMNSDSDFGRSFAELWNTETCHPLTTWDWQKPVLLVVRLKGYDLGLTVGVGCDSESEAIQLARSIYKGNDVASVSIADIASKSARDLSQAGIISYCP